MGVYWIQYIEEKIEIEWEQQIYFLIICDSKMLNFCLQDAVCYKNIPNPAHQRVVSMVNSMTDQWKDGRYCDITNTK